MAGSADFQEPTAVQLEQTIAEALDRLRASCKEGLPPESTGRDGFPVFATDRWAAVHRILNDYLAQLRLGLDSWRINPKEIPAGLTVLALPNAGKLVALRAIVVRILFHHQNEEATPAK